MISCAEEIAQLRATGKIAFREGRFEDAVKEFGEALSKAVKEFGELSEECAPIYVDYGEALLEASRAGDVDCFGDSVIEAAAAAEHDEEEEECEEEVEEEEENEAEDEVVEADDSNLPEEVSNENLQVNDKTEVAENGETENVAEETLSDRDLVWENLDTARVIYLKNPEKFKKELVDVHLLLGDVLMEFDNFTGAREEFTNALEPSIELFGEVSRKVASCYHSIGLSFINSEEFSPALDFIRKAYDSLLQYVEKSLNTNTKRDADFEEVFHQLQSSVSGITASDAKEELESCISALSELHSKIEDLEQYSAENKEDADSIRELVKSTMDEVLQGFSDNPFDVPEGDQRLADVKVNDLGTISKKRKSPDQDTVVESTKVKK